jgi:hypothetical protein
MRRIVLMAVMVIVVVGQVEGSIVTTVPPSLMPGEQYRLAFTTFQAIFGGSPDVVPYDIREVSCSLT